MAAAPSTRQVFVTGGTGYLGRLLIPLLQQRGHVVRALVRESSRSRLPSGSDAVIGDPLDRRSFAQHVGGADTFIQLVGVPKPAPWKGKQFRAVDRVSGLASIEAAREAGIRHFVYISVAHPAPIMQDYIAVRVECEAAISDAGLPASIVRPWYILGPGHWWPMLLKPCYWIWEQTPTKRASALRLGLVTIRQMLGTLVWAVEHPPESIRIIEVPEIRSLGDLRS